MMEDADTNDNVFVIHSHSLNHLDILEECQECGNYNIIGGFPKVVEARLEIDSQGNILESLTYVKRLSLSLYYGAQYLIRTIFFQLVCLEFHRFSENWANLLVCMLQHSPILQILKFEDDHPGCWDPDEGCWIPPSSAPECLFYHLKTFDCKDIEGTPRQKEVAIYILKNARQLVTATVSQHVFEELENATRGSRSCELTMG
ncbi:PREDICTED: F-box/FBD/LRR-repeat protein At5g56420-like isoform X1 [Camelina sativa]|uniref:F-box/FBD/LRR-repeat protein At5g56420-like isoform X1 n=1 Tax=Camelina sativa TaxID=90675 RepID=A0ABM0TRC0_CAMSA|nr:PREDICTED: F-box/FBD/LRR-repeat protein At5g56420-like isoform X1 [Camelina sativa]